MKNYPLKRTQTDVLEGSTDTLDAHARALLTEQGTQGFSLKTLALRTQLPLNQLTQRVINEQALIRRLCHEFTELIKQEENIALSSFFQPVKKNSSLPLAYSRYTKTLIRYVQPASPTDYPYQAFWFTLHAEKKDDRLPSFLSPAVDNVLMAWRNWLRLLTPRYWGDVKKRVCVRAYQASGDVYHQHAKNNPTHPQQAHLWKDYLNQPAGWFKETYSTHKTLGENHEL